MLIDSINSPEDLKKISINELPKLASEIRSILIKRASKYGGHFGSNLGIVEITIALHYVFNSPVDKIIFDVSHQCYPHKMLTGRKNAYIYEEDYTKVSGFTNPNESFHDWFNVGHTSTSISLACGLAKARDLKGEKENIIAVIGDASLDGGEAFEALNIAAELGTGFIVVVNDNEMSIPENHGALSTHLKRLKENHGHLQDNFFRALGYEYLFVEDGNSIQDCISAFEKIKGTQKPVIIHCCTIKGKGYKYSEENQEKWHHAHPFNIETGEFNKATSVTKENYGSIVGAYLMEKIERDPMVVAMTASVPACFGFNPTRRKKAGNQFIDVGIAEQNMITMAVGLAKGGAKTVTITESSFYQRAYDQIEQEMCRNNSPVTMLIAFSGIYGHNDDTHIGFFDISLFGNIPNLIFLAPSNKEEYLAMLNWSIEQTKFPVAIRIPWNGVYYTENKVPTDYSVTKYWIRQKGALVAIMALGSFYQIGEAVVELLKAENINATLIDPLFVSGYDTETLDYLKKNHKLIVTLEDGILSGGFGAHIAQYYGVTDIKVLNCGFSENIPTCFSVDEMMKRNNLFPDQIVTRIKDILNEGYRI